MSLVEKKEAPDKPPKVEQLVNIMIDGRAVSVPAGINLIEAAKLAGIEIPHYCYHPALSIAGNCRMCQVEVKGARKMEIACNTIVKEGMEVATHHSSRAVADSQAAVLEMILINHPLDCTVCDQAGHCKLQDYHYQYNAKDSRFLEEKERKVKAQPLGPTVMLDGERCIMCSRCVRFCDEVTGTAELGIANRGDRSVIVVHPDRELNNPFSGTVVDLCPVGALTHRQWRFNTRIWFTKQVDSICPGCSTGCNVKLASRDSQIVQVKARWNADVNKEWLCDYGRYGYGKFVPKERFLKPVEKINGAKQEITYDQAFQKIISAGEFDAIFLSGDLLTEEYHLVSKWLETLRYQPKIYLNYLERSLSDLEKILISPDYSPNYQGALFCDLIKLEGLKDQWFEGLRALSAGKLQRVLMFGDNVLHGLPAEFESVLSATLSDNQTVSKVSKIVFCGSDAASLAAIGAWIILPTEALLEKSGFYINRQKRMQFLDSVFAMPSGVLAQWQIIARLAIGVELTKAKNYRELSRHFLAERGFEGVTIAQIKNGGINLGGEL
ncbi:MAG TPA: 2Fe-2S iron-sulfur cluster-binding protein [Oligoflexia bacterium]|nr:2Fe-2S iron-sulfur cluster-binding protein [Oligoflexia bacterium]HMP27584.1 2Fe-2S iron-sulfur cluster-binding protein [Oligoflexia bacterium]